MAAREDRAEPPGISPTGSFSSLWGSALTCCVPNTNAFYFMWIFSGFTWVFRDSDSNRLDANALLPLLPGFSCCPFPSPAGHDCPSPPPTQEWLWGWQDPAMSRGEPGHPERAALSPKTRGQIKKNQQGGRAAPALSRHHQHLQDLHWFSEMLTRGQPSLDTNNDIPLNAVQDVFK